MANPVTPEKKGKRPTTFKDTYKKDFPCIGESRKGPTHAFCTECRSDFSLAADRSNDIRNHIQTTKHQTNVKHANGSNKSLTLDRFFHPDNFDVINAEVTFTDFLVEHNMQLSASDHAGACFRKMFPDSKIACQYACAQ